MTRFNFIRKPSLGSKNNALLSSADPLSFLLAGRSAGSGKGKDAFNQIVGSFHDAVSDADRAIKAVIEGLRYDRNVSDHMAVQANISVREEMARAVTLAAAKRDNLLEEISFRLQSMFVQNLLESPYQEPPVRRWINLVDRTGTRDLPVVAEPALSRLDGNRGERQRRLRRWQRDVDQWMEVLCVNSAAEVAAKLVKDIGDYSSAWTDTVNQLRRESGNGGRLSCEVSDPDNWAFDNDDPTVKNLVSGVRAQETARRILNHFRLSDADVSELCQEVYDALGGKRIYGPGRIDFLELETILASGIANRIKNAVGINEDFLSLATDGSGRVGEDLAELLVEMRMGAAAMEEKMWRMGENRFGHVDSAAGVGITAPSVHDSVVRALGGARKFAAAEGPPTDKHRFEVQMSTVGASLSDLAIFQDMVNAWYSWHFEERRGEIDSRNARAEAVRKDSWKLYPDIGQDSGVRPAVIELIDDDLRQVWNTPGDVALRLSYGHVQDSDGEAVETVDKSQPQLPG